MERGSEREWVWSWRRILTTSRGAMTKLFRDIGLGWVWGGGGIEKGVEEVRSIPRDYTGCGAGGGDLEAGAFIFEAVAWFG